MARAFDGVLHFVREARNEVGRRMRKVKQRDLRETSLGQHDENRDQSHGRRSWCLFEVVVGVDEIYHMLGRFANEVLAVLLIPSLE